jgi:c-di-GMP-binding flagellar brake protein YcgR
MALSQVAQTLEQRRSFRLKATLEPMCVFRLLINPAHLPANDDLVIKSTIADISAGGVCLVTKQNAALGDLLGMVIVLTADEDLVVRMRVVSITEPVPGNHNRRLHCEFLGLQPRDNDRIARFVLRAQLELRRRGLL